MAEARDNLSIMGWGATLLSYALASMAYAGLFTTEPWGDTGGFGTLSSLIFIIGIAFFIIGLIMQIFGGEEAPGRMPALDRFRNIFRRRGAPPAPGGPGAPPAAAAQTLAPETPPPPEGPEPPPAAAAQTLAAGAPTPPKAPTPKTGAPTPGAPRKTLPGPRVSEKQLLKWIRRLDENSLPPTKYSPTAPIFEKKFEIDTKTPILKNIHQVFEEVISAYQQRLFQHPDIIGPRSRFSQNLTDYYNFFREIFQRVDRLRVSRDLGEQERIRHELNRFTNEAFRDYNRWLWRELRKEHRERTGREMKEEAPKEKKKKEILKGLPPPMEKTAMKKAAPEQTGAPTFGYPDVRYPSGSPVHLDIDDFNYALKRLNAARFRGGNVLEKIPKNYQRKLQGLYEASDTLNVNYTEFRAVKSNNIFKITAKLMYIATDLDNFYRMQERINQGQQPDKEAQIRIGRIKFHHGKLTFKDINALITQISQVIHKEMDARKKAPAGAI